jgi:hypothetical protein
MTVAPPPAFSAPSCGPVAGVQATFGVDAGGTEAAAEELVPFLVSGLALEFDQDNLRTADARPQYRGSKFIGRNLCVGRTLLARFPFTRPTDKVVGLSVNGRYVAWRVVGAHSRGVMYVGRVERRKIVAVRATTNATLRRNRQRNERILVMPDGTAAWSLRQNREPGVWLWPNGKAPRKLATVAAQDGPDTSTDVRIIDNRHVYLPETQEIVRYGPKTEGHCPRTVGGPTFAAGPLRILSITIPSGFDSSESRSETHALICDASAGDYVRVLPTSNTLQNQYAAEGSNLIRLYRTAGVYLTLDARYDSSGVSAYVVAVRPPIGVPGTPLDGTLGPQNLDPATAIAAPPITPLGPRVVPGAIAWLVRNEDQSSAVWLADAEGTRPVGPIAFASDITAATAPRFQLDSTTLSWDDGGVRRSVPVSPAATPIDSGAPTTR